MPITQVVPTLIVLFGMAIALLFGHTAEFPRYQEAVRAVAVDLSISHAEERHGEAALVARQCYERNSTRFYNPMTGRSALVCKTDSGKFGVIILDDMGREVTAFLKDKCRRWEQIVRYMRNAGYEPLH